MPFWFNDNGNVCVSAGGNPILCATAPCYDSFTGGLKLEADHDSLAGPVPSNIEFLTGGLKLSVDHIDLAGP